MGETMLIGALVLGILGGLFGLLIGLAGYTLGGIAGSGGLQAVSMAIPIVSIIGGAMAKTKPMVAGSLMVLSSIGMFSVFGFNFFTAIPLVLSAAGGLLAVTGMSEAKQVVSAQSAPSPASAQSGPLPASAQPAPPPASAQSAPPPASAQSAPPPASAQSAPLLEPLAPSSMVAKPASPPPHMAAVAVDATAVSRRGWGSEWNKLVPIGLLTVALLLAIAVVITQMKWTEKGSPPSKIAYLSAPGRSQEPQSAAPAVSAPPVATPLPAVSAAPFVTPPPAVSAPPVATPLPAVSAAPFVTPPPALSAPPVETPLPALSGPRTGGAPATSAVVPSSPATPNGDLSRATKQLGPSFDCNVAQQPLAQMLCADAELSRVDLRFAQAYWALLGQVGDGGSRELKQEDLQFLDAVQQQCGIPRLGPAVAQTGVSRSCVKNAYEAQRAVWILRLTPPFSEEANRPIERHIALQRSLQRAIAKSW